MLSIAHFLGLLYDLTISVRMILRGDSMRYPKFLRERDIIGLVAPSFGACGVPYGLRQERAEEYFTDMGYSFKKVPHVNVIENGESAPADVRVKEFMDMWMDEDVDFICSVAGGEKELQVLPYLDIEKLSSTPKYFMGYSDNTTICYALTVLCDMASIYGIHLMDFGVDKWDECLQYSYEFMLGKKMRHDSFPMVQWNDLKHEYPYSPYNLEFENEWKNLHGEDRVDITGRIIGGCLDVLVGICGTKYDHTVEFVEKYKDDGIIWYLEACDLNPFGAMRALWQLREAGWFKYTKGFIIGRPNNPSDVMEYSHMKAVEEILGVLGVPVIMDFDVGHVAPTVPILNGSIAHVVNGNGESYIEFKEV